MNLPEQIEKHAQALPLHMQQELWDYVQFLEFRLQKQDMDAVNTDEINTASKIDCSAQGNTSLPATPITDSLVGILKEMDADKAVYHRYLAEKYL